MVQRSTKTITETHRIYIITIAILLIKITWPIRKLDRNIADC